MIDSIKHINTTRAKIAKLEKDFSKRGPHHAIWGFTIDLSYAGNEEPDVRRISIGSCADPEGTGQQLYDLVLSSLKNSLKFWEDVAKRDLIELQEALYKKD